MTHWLINRMRSRDADLAISCEGSNSTYADLVEGILEWRRQADIRAAPTGSVFSVEGGYSPEAVSLLFALFTLGHVVVPIGCIPADKEAEFLAVASVEYRCRPSGDGRWEVVRTAREAAHEFYTALRREASSGLVLFSSGTTGRSKAAVLNLSKLIEKHVASRRPRITLGFLTLDHIGGLNTLFHTLAHGGMLVAPSNRTPDGVCRAIAEHRVEVLPTTPTFLNLCLISGALKRHEVGSLQLITYGTEPMPPVTLERLAKLLPEVRMKQTYGLSEVGILPTISRGDSDLWLKIGGDGFEHKIVSDILWIRSETAMLGYLNAEAPFDQDGYFNTQDVVEVDGDWLRILGRRSEIINVGGEKVYPAEVEDAILQLPDVLDVTVVGRPSPVMGMVVQAVVRPARVDVDAGSFASLVRSHCAARLEPFKVPALIRVSNEEQHSDRFKKTRKVVR